MLLVLDSPPSSFVHCLVVGLQIGFMYAQNRHSEGSDLVLIASFPGSATGRRLGKLKLKAVGLKPLIKTRMNCNLY